LEPVMLMPVSARAAVPPFDSVTLVPLLDPTAVDPKEMDVALKAAEGPEPPVAVPLRAMLCGELLALSTACKVAVRLPETSGLNVIVTLHVVPAARLVPQLFVWRNEVVLVPVILRLVIVSVAVPVFVSVALALLVAPTAVDPNEIETALNEAAGAVAVAVPDRETAWGELYALSATLSEAESEPVAAGLNVIVIVQFAAAARLAGQVFVCENDEAFSPMIENPVIERANFPEFVRVTVFAALAKPWTVDGNDRLVGESVTRAAFDSGHLFTTLVTLRDPSPVARS
jgi:hypothetical protein